MNEPHSQFHGYGWKAMLQQANYLERLPNNVHVVFSIDPFTGLLNECLLDNPTAVREMVRELRLKAEEMRLNEDSSPWN